MALLLYLPLSVAIFMMQMEAGILSNTSFRIADVNKCNQESKVLLAASF